MAWKRKPHKGYGLGKGAKAACVVVNQSPQHGTYMWGPFTEEEQAHAWMRENIDGELMNIFETATPPGAVTYVTYMQKPTVSVWFHDKE